MKQIWVDKYRPNTTNGYVFQDSMLKSQIEQWINDGSFPHILLRGGAGTGKTTLSKILIEGVKVQDTDVLYVNGSKEGRKVEWIDKLIMFCSTMPFGDFKVVFIDEADYMNHQSVQPALRNLMEEFSSTVRFIATCNYPHRIIPPLRSRFQTIQLETFDIVEFTEKAATILINENIKFDLDVLDTYIKSSYPDLRTCINNLELYSIDGQLKVPDSTSSSADYKIEMVNLFKQGKISEARKLICSQALPEEMEEIYTWLYNNVELFGDENQQDKAILIIKQGLVDHTIISDPEINLAATLIRLANI